MPHQGHGVVAAVLAGIAMASAAASAVAAETAEAVRIRELESKLERSLQMIEVLQKRMQQLESRIAGNKPETTTSPPAMAQTATEQTAKIEALERQVSQMSSGLSMRRSDTGAPLHGFADVGLRRSGENSAYYGRGLKGFQVGSLDLYLSPQFGDRVRMLAEPNIEVDDRGNTALDLERLQIGYAVSDSLTAWGGRFHTPIGYWNTAFHHGAQIQTSIKRPRFLDFEDKGGILPAHTTGVWLTGVLPAGGGKFGYDFYLGNSQRIVTDAANPVGPGNIATGVLDMKMAGSSSTNAVAGFNAWLSPASVPELRLGLHGMRSNIAVVDDSHAILDQSRLQMLGGYGVFANDNWEIMGEYYHFNNRDITRSSGGHRSTAWYGQAGYNFGLITPYLRLERTGLEQADSYFAYQTNGRSYSRIALGLRYEVDPKSALKIEANRTKKRDLLDAITGVPAADDSYAETSIQYSVRF